MTRYDFPSTISKCLKIKTNLREGERYELCTVLLAECE